MNEMQHQVLEFHRKFGVAFERHPTLPSDTVAALRCDLIKEEAQEFEDAIYKGDLIESIDALVDILYVTFGAANAMGVNLQEHFDVVHKANMRKEGGQTRSDGKILKPEGWIPPNVDHQRILAKHQSDLFPSL